MITSQQNTWIGGMNRDVAKNKATANQYYNGENIRVLTNSGLTTGNICDENGNKLEFRTPLHLYRIYKLTLGTNNGIFSFTFTGLKPIPITISVTDIISIDNLYQKLTSTNSQLYSFIQVKNIAIFNNKSYLTFVCLNKDVFITHSGDCYSEISVYKQNNVQIVGWTSARNYILVFTISTANDAGATSLNNASQIWKLEYNKATVSISGLSSTGYLLPEIHLSYNNILNFSTVNRMFCYANYETPEVAKVYFTDKTNQLRHFNFLDPNTLGYPPDRLDIVPAHTDAPLVVTSVQEGGEYMAGMVQYTYCLFNKYGSQTAYTTPTNFVHLTGSSESSSDNSKYFGNPKGESVSKSVTLTFGSTAYPLDRNFGYLRLVSIFIDTAYATPVIEIVTETAIPDVGILTLIDSGRHQGSIAQEELLSTGTIDFKCATLAVKDNILFPTNITQSKYNPVWDARAYRFCETKIGLGNRSAILKSSDGTQIEIPEQLNGVNNVDFLDINGNVVPEQHDCIQSKEDQLIYKYLPNMLSNVLGGEGKNVKYEFDFQQTILDATNGNCLLLGASVSTSYASAVFQEEYTGYMRDEKYRFGIQLKNTKGLWSDARWIADIKFPTAIELDYARTYWLEPSDNSIRGNILHLKVTVKDLPSDAVAWRIVRVERKEEDKSIITQGMYLPAYNDVDKGLCAHPTGELNILSPIYWNYGVSLPTEYSLPVGNFVSPEISFRKDFNKSSGDTLHIIGVTEGSTSNTYAGQPSAAQTVGDATGINIKIGNCYPIDFNGILVKDSALVPVGGYLTKHAVGTYFYTNYRWYNGATSYGYFATNLTLQLDNQPNVYNSALPYGCQFGIAVANYVRNNDLAQYGGAGYSNRANNTYITCGKETIGTNVNNPTNIFGGDTYISLFDCLACPMDMYEPSVYNSADIIIPMESSINLNLRHDVPWHNWSTVNRIFLQETAGTYGLNSTDHIIQTKDMYLYNTAYSRQNNIVPAFSKGLLDSDNQKFDCMIMASQPKSSGQTFDKWTQFFASSNITVEGAFGEITRIVPYDEYLMFFQEKALGVVSVNQKALTVPDETGTSLLLGKGGVLDDFKYISRTVGCSHPYSIQVVDFPQNSIYFYDYNTYKIYRYITSVQRTERAQVLPLSSIEGISSLINNLDRTILSNDTPFSGSGVHGVYDVSNSRVLFTFMLGVNSGFTLAFNTLMNAFEGKYPYHPSMLLSHDNMLLSTGKLNTNRNECWIYYGGNPGQYFGEYYDSKISWIVNKEPEFSKLFNTLRFNMTVTQEGAISIGDPVGDDNNSGNNNNNNKNLPPIAIDTTKICFKYIRVYNEYQDTGYVELVYGLNIKRLNRVWHLAVPHIKKNNISQRVRSQEAIFELVFTHDENNLKFCLEDIITGMTIR